MFEISVEETFAAAHTLRDYHGKCENLHGHNYRVQVKIEGERLNATGLLVDFVEVKRILREAIDRLDHSFLNEVPPFDTENPSAENIARHICRAVSAGLASLDAAPPVRVASVKVWETDTSTASYRP